MTNKIIKYQRNKEEFFKPGVDEKIAQLRFDHHRLRVQDSLKSVRDLRNEIVRRDQKKQESAVSENKAEIMSKALNTFHSRISQKTAFPKSPKKNHTKERSKSTTPVPMPNSTKTHLMPAEKKRMIDFVTKTWKEINAIKKQENDTLSRGKTISQIKESDKEELAPRYKAKDTIICKGQNGEFYMSPRKSQERLLSTDRECIFQKF